MTYLRVLAFSCFCLVLLGLSPFVASQEWNEPTDEDYKITASDGDEGDSFGASVAIDGDVLIVGANKDNDNGDSSGSAYVFRFDEEKSAWVEEQKLTASDGEEGDEFGIYVAVSADVVVVGAFRDDDDGDASGSAYVFNYDGDEWIEGQKLTASDAEASDRFGESLSIDGEVIVIASHHDDEIAEQAGSAYVFRYETDEWVEEQKLNASDGEAFDHYGESVFVNDNVIVIGSHFDDDGGTGAGSAYVYRFDGEEWTEEQKLLASDADTSDTYGNWVSVSGDIIVVGAYANDDDGSNSGSAYVYRYEDDEWIEEQKLTASDAAAGDQFGEVVSLSGNTIAISARLDDDSGTSSGSAYIFRYDGEEWFEEQKLVASDGVASHGFGLSVFVKDDVAVVGATLDDDVADQAGAAYVFGLADEFVRGDVNADGVLNLADPIAGLVYLFLGGSVSCREALDVNDNGMTELADPIYELMFLYTDGPDPPSPYSECGEADSETLGCASYDACL